MNAGAIRKTDYWIELGLREHWDQRRFPNPHPTVLPEVTILGVLFNAVPVCRETQLLDLVIHSFLIRLAP